MKFRKSTIITLAILTIAMLPTSVSYAQFWEALKEIGKGVGSVVLENYIDNNPNYSSEVKQSMKNDLNTINNAININQNAANATRDAYNGNYTGAVIQGAQTIMNATGKYQYDTYLNSANQINNANREYKQDIQNGMDKNAALDKRNTTIGYSAAESAIELQDKIARERAEKARQQREAEQQSWSNNSYYSTPSYNEPYPKTSTSSFNKQDASSNVPEESWQILRAYAEGKESDSNNKVSEYRKHNSNSQILSPSCAVKFLTDEGEPIYIHMLFHGNGEGSYLSYYNHSDQARQLSCNRVTICVVYNGDNEVHTYTDACSFVMPAHTAKNLEWSDIFPRLSPYLSDTYEIESVSVGFGETQIR